MTKSNSIMDALSRLTNALRCLPGVGPKSAQRMAFQLLNGQRQRGLHLAACLDDAMQNIKHCTRCNNYTDIELCNICQNSSRDSSTLCIVESPADVIAIEQSHGFNGLYFVLMNKISPIDGIGPDEIGLPRLKHRVISEQVQEVILALSPTVEGITTAHFIDEALREHEVKVSQLAHGIPSGGELEFMDSHTITSALQNRLSINFQEN